MKRIAIALLVVLAGFACNGDNGGNGNGDTQIAGDERAAGDPGSLDEFPVRPLDSSRHKASGCGIQSVDGRGAQMPRQRMIGNSRECEEYSDSASGP